MDYESVGLLGSQEGTKINRTELINQFAKYIQGCNLQIYFRATSIELRMTAVPRLNCDLQFWAVESVTE